MTDEDEIEFNKYYEKAIDDAIQLCICGHIKIHHTDCLEHLECCYNDDCICVDYKQHEDSERDCKIELEGL